MGDLAVVELFSGDAGDPRATRRSNVYLAATLVASGASRPVRLRNISAVGALLDAPDLPAEGTSVELRRGRLGVRGEIAWQSGAHCGVRFDAEVIVADWVKRVHHEGQEHVDDMIRRLRGDTTTATRLTPVERESRDTLASISAELLKSCERLANVTIIVAEHSEALLELDAIAQRLARFAAARDGA
jgi:hypothetical protein